MKTLFPVMVAFLSLLVITASQARADTPAKISISGTTYVQNDGRWSDDNVVYTSTIEKVRVNTKDLLELFAEALDLSQPFPKGSTVEVGSDFTVTVNFKGQTLANVTPFFVITVDEEFDNLDQIKYNDATQQQTSTHIYPISIRIGNDDGSLDDNGYDDDDDDDSSEVELQVSGVAFESFKAGAAKAGMQSVSTSLKANVSGDGTVGSDNAMFVGTITAKGKGYEDVD